MKDYFSIKSWLYIFLLLVIGVKANAQLEAIRFENVRYMDSSELQVKEIYCNGLLLYPDKRSEKKMKSDKVMVDFLNKVYNPEIRLSELNALLGGFKKATVSKDERQNGLLTFSKYIIKGNYLRLELNISHIEDVIVRKHFFLTTLSSGRCDVSSMKILDYSLLKELITGIEFKVGIWDHRYLYNETYCFDELNVLSSRYPGYRFNIPDILNKDLVNRAFCNQYNNDSSRCYSYQTPDKYFASFVKNGQLDVIEMLLYSPNYFYSVNAMEALIYLQSIGKANIDSKMNERIKSLKESKYKITIRKTSDFYSTVEGYSSIGVTDAMVIQKYKDIK
jgi:hypothetical protein